MSNFMKKAWGLTNKIRLDNAYLYKDWSDGILYKPAETLYVSAGNILRMERRTSLPTTSNDHYYMSFEVDLTNIASMKFTSMLSGRSNLNQEVWINTTRVYNNGSNVAAGVRTINVTSYTGVCTITFGVKCVSTSCAGVSEYYNWTLDDVPVFGNSYTSPKTVLIDSITLTDNVDYTLMYSTHKPAGTSVLIEYSTGGAWYAASSGTTITGNDIQLRATLTSDNEAFTPTITDMWLEYRLASISVDTPPTKLLYNVGDKFSLVGAVVLGLFSDGLYEPIPHNLISNNFISLKADASRTVQLAARGASTSIDVEIVDNRQTDIFKDMGQKIGLQFTEPLSGDVTGLLPRPLGVSDNYDLLQAEVLTSSDFSTSNTGQNLLDGSTSTYWRPSAYPCWVQLDFGAPIFTAGFRWYANSYRPKDFRVEASNDGETWIELLADVSANTANWVEFQWYPLVAYRYYKWYIDTTYSANYLYLCEIEMRRPALNADAFTIAWQEYDFVGGTLVDKSTIPDEIIALDNETDYYNNYSIGTATNVSFSELGIRLREVE